jgi:hypothetical protein
MLTALTSEVINNIGTNPRKYESSIQKGEMERSQQQLSEAMIKAMPYYKWFTTRALHDTISGLARGSRTNHDSQSPEREHEILDSH